MFHDIPDEMAAQMRHLEAIDASDRQDGTAQSHRLRQVPRETGHLLAILAASAPAGSIIEIGTSAGYSALWISLACASRGAEMLTFEILPSKAELARATFRAAGVEGRVHVVEGDARNHIPELKAIAFCFLDAEKDVYSDCYELVVPRLVPGGLIVADNLISHRDELQGFMGNAIADTRMDSVLVPLGSGLLVSRRC